MKRPPSLLREAIAFPAIALLVAVLLILWAELRGPGRQEPPPRRGS